MPDDFEDQSLDEWIAFADHDHGVDEKAGSWRHPLVYATLGIGLLVVIGLIVLRPTGEARAYADAGVGA